MNEEFDISAITASIPMFNEIDILVDEFYTKIKNKEPKTINDVLNNKIDFISILNSIISKVNKSNYEEEDKQTLISRLTIDFYVTYAEKYNLDVFSISEKYNDTKRLHSSLEYLKT